MHLHRLRLLPFAACLLAPFALSAQLALIPMPREVHDAAPINVVNGVSIVCNQCDKEDAFAADDLGKALFERGISVASTTAPQIALMRVNSSEAKSALSNAHITWTSDMDAEGYVILPAGNGIAVIGRTPSGVFYGAQTAKQLVDANKMLHTATIRDWPTLKIRGLDDDLSRGPVPTLEFQKKQIRILASFKLNVYSPYFEHTMQYASQPLMAPPGGSISAAEARELVAYAAKYHITVIPEQEAFGHVHYLLNYEQYSPLSETPHGQVMAPGQPGSLQLTKQMFIELSQIYPSPWLHVGADETNELGRGQTKADVDARGLGAVYLDYMQKIVAELKPLNRKILFWGDIAMHDPALVKALPQTFKDSVIAIGWEYNPQPKGFGPWIKPYIDAGIECWVAPGVNNWSRVYPNNNNMFANIQKFTAEGQKGGCTGQLNTIWNDDGEGLVNSDWYGILYGAAAAWQQGEAPIPQFQSAYGAVFHGDATGKIDEAQKEMMLAHALLKDNFKQSDGSDLLFWVDPWSPDGQHLGDLIRPYTSELRLHAERAIVLVRQARMTANLRELDALDALELGARRMDLIGLKFQVTDEIANYYALASKNQTSKVKTERSLVGSSLGAINGVNGKLQDLRDGYSLTRDLYEQAWLKSYRPYWLHNNLARYDLTTQLWLSRIDKVRSAQRQWTATQTIPTAAELGIPAPPVTAAH